MVQSGLMESQQDEPLPITASFASLFLVWSGVTSSVIILGFLLIFNLHSPQDGLYLLGLSSICGAFIGLSGAGILVNSRPRKLRARRRFGRVLGLCMPFLLFYVLPLVLGMLRISVIPMLIVWKFFWANIFFVPFVFAGSILGGDLAAQRCEGRSPKDLIASIFRRG